MRLRSISNAVVTLATAGSLVNATPAPHQHGHTHADKRTVKVDDVDVAGPIVFEYELNGKIIDQSEVCEGIQAGSLQWVDGSKMPTWCSQGAEPVLKPTETPSTTILPATSNTALIASSATPAYITHPETPNNFAKEDVKVSSTPAAKASSKPVPNSIKALPSQTQASPMSSNLLGGHGLDQEFPEGELDCTTFPSDYGPINVEWAGLKGWTGIQYVTIVGNSVAHIDTAVPGGEGCKPGAMCSYACPAGYQKSQWPSQQGSTGQSVGGLHCNSNGKLALTNPGLSKNLCIQGTGAVTVENKLSNNAAICRTDYPGL